MAARAEFQKILGRGRGVYFTLLPCLSACLLRLSICHREERSSVRGRGGLLRLSVCRLWAEAELSGLMMSWLAEQFF
jgi:hypothetical protein